MAWHESLTRTRPPGPDEPLDCVIVLGGGTSQRWTGEAQLAGAGDRLATAIRLYHRGLVKRIIVTGDSLRGLPTPLFDSAPALDPSEQSRAILVESGIEASQIEELPGTNTFEEISALKARPELWQQARCGLITSQFHLPRAMSLAKRLDVQVIPITSDVRSRVGNWYLRDCVPSGEGLAQTELILREWMGMAIGR